jgi:hypothetical protein
MSTAERIAWGAWGLLSFIALIAWLRWEGTPQDEKKSGASPEGEDANPSTSQIDKT